MVDLRCFVQRLCILLEHTALTQIYRFERFFARLKRDGPMLSSLPGRDGSRLQSQVDAHGETAVAVTEIEDQHLLRRDGRKAAAAAARADGLQSVPHGAPAERESREDSIHWGALSREFRLIAHDRRKSGRWSGESSG